MIYEYECYKYMDKNVNVINKNQNESEICFC